MLINYTLAGGLLCLILGSLGTENLVAAGPWDIPVDRSGIGVDYFNCFERTLADGNDTSYEQGFETLAQDKIPFVRFNCGGFWPPEMRLYLENRDEYLRRLAGVVHSAEKNHVGLVPSLFWNITCIPDLVGEPLSAWGNPNSKTIAFMRGYVHDVVSRFKDSPAILAWEFGNEWNNISNLQAKNHHPYKVFDPHNPLLAWNPPTRSAADDMSITMVESALKEFVHAVRALDAKHPLSTGFALPRPFAWHVLNEGNAHQDTRAEFAQSLLLQSPPDEFQWVSVHVYRRDGEFFAGENVSVPELIAECNRIANSRGQKLLMGEFGETRVGYTPQQQLDRLQMFLDAIVKVRVPYSAVWVYDFAAKSVDSRNFTITATNDRAEWLTRIAAANQKLWAETSRN